MMLGPLGHPAVNHPLPLTEDMPLPFYTGVRPIACRHILLVDYRDEVFFRLSADLTSKGLAVERATCTADAAKVCDRRPVELMLVNVDLPDDDGWLLAAKLRLLSAAPRIWLYAPRPLPDAVTMAEYVGADGLIAYEDDLDRLSAAVISRVSVLPEQWADTGRVA